MKNNPNSGYQLLSDRWKNVCSGDSYARSLIFRLWGTWYWVSYDLIAMSGWYESWSSVCFAEYDSNAKKEIDHLVCWTSIVHSWILLFISLPFRRENVNEIVEYRHVHQSYINTSIHFGSSSTCLRGFTKVTGTTPQIIIFHICEAMKVHVTSSSNVCMATTCVNTYQTDPRLLFTYFFNLYHSDDLNRVQVRSRQKPEDKEWNHNFFWINTL